MASRSIICRSRRLRQIIDLRDIDKSQYFTITEFDNCFIIRSPSLFLYLNHSLTAHPKRPTIFSPRAWLQLRMSRILFAGHVVGSRPMKRKKKMHRMIITFIYRMFHSGHISLILLLENNCSSQIGNEHYFILLHCFVYRTK